MRKRYAAAAVATVLWVVAAGAAAAAAASARTACELESEVGRGSFALAVARTLPAVATVIVIRETGASLDDVESLDFFPPLANSSPASAPTTETPALERMYASGFFIAADGFMVTSAHAVRNARQAWVAMADGRNLEARVVGLDRRTDVALLKVNAHNVPVVRTDPAPLCPGEAVAALGSPFGFASSVAVGVISAYPRFVAGASAIPFIQTDVAINPGSSGGPLFDARGRVLGMNSMLYSASGTYIGVAFALPIDRVLQIASEMRANSGSRVNYIGAVTQPMTVSLAQAFGVETPGGTLVVGIDRGSRASEAQLKLGDILLAVNGNRIFSDGDLENALGRMDPATPITLGVWRQRRYHSVVVGRAPRPGNTPSVPPAGPVDGLRLGLTFATADKVARLPAGAYVAAVAGSALVAGVDVGDRITAVNETPVGSAVEFDAALAQVSGRSVVALLIMRDSVSLYIGIRRMGHLDY